MSKKKLVELDKQAANRLATMVESELICYKHYFPWIDEIIAQNPKPPRWILKLSTIKYIPKAVKTIYEFVYSEPFEQFDDVRDCDNYVACLYLRYERKELSWATFLDEAGKYTDECEGRCDYDYFFAKLNEYQDSEYSDELKSQQVQELQQTFSDVTEEIRQCYLPFVDYFREYTRKSV